MSQSRTAVMAVVIGVAAAVLPLGCSGTNKGTGELAGKITIDGSSTVAPLTEKVAEEFKKLHPGVAVSVGISGTGGGFKKFYAGETDISDASRPIKESEKQKCKENGIEFVELKVAIDGLAVVVHPENTWARKLTVEQLEYIWRPDNPAKKWSDLNPNWPNETIRLFGAGTNSGTFDYFTEAICGQEDRSRTDYTSSEDDNVIVKGVAGDVYALGYFGLAYYQGNKDRLQLVAIKDKGGDDYYLPTEENINSGRYSPLSRPLFIYVRLASLKRPEVREFVKFYLDHPEYASVVGYIPLSESAQLEQRQRFEEALKKVEDK